MSRLSFAVRSAVGAVLVSLACAASAQVPERQMAQTVSPPATKNPFAGNAAAVQEGRTVYNATCTRCHGVDGAAGEFAPGLAVSGRLYTIRTDQQIFDVIKKGVQGTAMPAHERRLSDDQMWKITAYIYGLRGTAIDAPIEGDAVRGEAIFFGKGQCDSCHMVGGRGAIIGPDLTNVASVRKTNVIVEALTRPGRRALPPGGYQVYQLKPLETYPVVRVKLPNGQEVRGVVRNEDSYSMQIMGLDEKLYLVERSKLRSVIYEPGRLMPSDYDKRLSRQEFNDLLAFVTRLSQSPAGVP